jgi:tetratricopeptide (TPR) repeat protein
MQKLGRNDLCYCGSGNKYKKCCLSKDEAGNITRISASPETHSGPMNLSILIHKTLPWKHELYKMEAIFMVNSLANDYSAEEISVAIQLWNDFSNEEEPAIKKAGSYPAAIEYWLSQMHGHDATQSMLAEKYNVSAGTISQRSTQIMTFAMEKIAEMNNFGAAPPQAVIVPSLNDSKPIKAKKGPSAKAKAQDILYAAWDEPSDTKRIQLAKQALELFPDSPDAYNILAESDARTIKEAAKYYERGILAGEREISAKFFNENKGHFWGITSTRPYMRAKLGYANACSQMGKEIEAIKHYTELLELNPNDNQGAREMLSLSYLETEQLAKAAVLHKKFQEDATANLSYDRVLVEYGLNGITAKLTKLLNTAISKNKHLPSYLIGKKAIPREIPDNYGFGDVNEAIVYADSHRHLWQNAPELIELLKKHGN